MINLLPVSENTIYNEQIAKKSVNILPFTTIVETYQELLIV